MLKYKNGSFSSNLGQKGAHFYQFLPIFNDFCLIFSHIFLLYLSQNLQVDKPAAVLA